MTVRGHGSASRREGATPTGLLAGGRPWSGFAEAAEAALALLQAQVGLDLWAVTQVRGDEQVVVTARSTGFPIPAGAVLPWAESLCVHMCNGSAPRIAPRVREVPAYADTGVEELRPIGAYVGVPVLLEDGQVFGTLCGIAKEEQPDDLQRALPLLEFVAGVLSTLLAKEALAADLSAAAAEAYARTSIDATTLLANPRGWEQALRVQDDRRTRYGEPASVLVLRVLLPVSGGRASDSEAGPPEDQVRQVSELLRSACRPSDVRARLGEAEFAVLTPNCDPLRQEALCQRLVTTCGSAGLVVVVGRGSSDASTSPMEAWRAAQEQAGAALLTAPAPRAPQEEGILVGQETDARLPQVERHDLPYAVVVGICGDLVEREAVLALRGLMTPALLAKEDHRPVLLDLTGLRSWSVPAQLTLLRSVRGLRQHGRYVAAYGLSDLLARQAGDRGWGQWVPCYRDLATALAHLPL